MSTPSSLSPLLHRRRTIILTVGAVAIIVVGAYTGAQLKSDLQVRRRNEVVQEGIDGRIRRFVFPFVFPFPFPFFFFFIN
ncbi:hypothetical protein HOY80DRAFT_939404 [Tuber brumale]|nr:hypothetical protein HOY80DRAFT_939404 [Tuber brumale]